MIGSFSTEIPDTRRERMRGLLGRAQLAPGHAMFLERARSVHTFGMRFAIQVAFLDRDYRVVQTRVVRPRRLARNRRARHTLELGVGERVVVGAVLSPAGPAPRTTPGARGSGRRART
jgi:uncharacterized membrane protein (UPF0127 family)